MWERLISSGASSRGTGRSVQARDLEYHTKLEEAAMIELEELVRHLEQAASEAEFEAGNQVDREIGQWVRRGIRGLQGWWQSSLQRLRPPRRKPGAVILPPPPDQPLGDPYGQIQQGG